MSVFNVIIRDATAADFSSIIEIAYKTWPKTYGEILSAAQLEFMLRLFYNEQALEQNKSNGQHFLIVFEGKNAIAFASYENNYADKTTHIHKIYVLPELHKRGIGKRLLNEIEKRATGFGDQLLSLNVNRFNNARYFYEKNGFEILREVDIEIGNGYLMQDFIMQKAIM